MSKIFNIESNQVIIRPVQMGSVNFFRPAAYAAIFVCLLYFWHRYFATPLPPKEQIYGFFNTEALRFKLFASGPIPYAIAWTFFFGITYLWQINIRKLFPLNISNVADRDIIEAAKGHDITFVRKLNEFYSKGLLVGYYGSRLHKLRKRYEDKDIASVIALKNDILEVDEEDLALSFTAIVWCEAALPLLGFLGTVVGIGGALGGIKGAVQLLFANSKGATTNLNQKVVEMFGQGFRDLAVAFDTTFLGLMGLIILGIFHNQVKNNWPITW